MLPSRYLPALSAVIAPLTLAAALSAAVPARASDTAASAISVVEPFARATPGAAKAGGAYLTIRNDGAEADTLVDADADVAKRVELHTHINDNGIMRMRKVEGIAVPAHETTQLKPGGYHVMFIGLKAPLKKGDSFPVTLTFKKAGKVSFTMPVMGVGAMSGAMDHGKMDHSTMEHGKMDHGSMTHEAPAQ